MPRSRSYPVIPLSEASELLRDRLNGLGTGACPRRELAQKLGYADGAGGIAARKISALVQFGFLEKGPAVGSYRLTPLGRLVQTAPPTDAEFRTAIRAAFHRPALFNDVLESCADARLPVNLAEVLERRFGLTRAARARAAKVLLDSGEFAGVVDHAGNLAPTRPSSDSADLESVESRIDSADGDPLETLSRLGRQLYDGPDWHVEPIDLPLPGGMRGRALVIVPSNLDRRGFERFGARIGEWISDLHDHLEERPEPTTLPFPDLRFPKTPSS